MLYKHSALRDRVVSISRAWRTPTQCPKAHRYHVKTCKVAANSATELFRKSSFQQLSVHTIGRLGFICEGWSFCPISKQYWKADTIGVRRNGQNGIHVKLCRLASEKHCIGPKMVSEAISAPKFQTFSWGACPDPPTA